VCIRAAIEAETEYVSAFMWRPSPARARGHATPQSEGELAEARHDYWIRRTG